MKIKIKTMWICPKKKKKKIKGEMIGYYHA